ncbi:hypothetical protein LTR08_002751 [Meristemomyces frigidus]|nr:hypothetical protein LTR08_002751 [Meristemomyces frigidus]
MSAQSNPGPTATATSSQPSPAALQKAFDHAIWYALSLWPALHVACQNAWGGEATLDKKDWFAGAVSDLFTQDPAADQEDLEVFLLQIMQDEFECNVEDDSECAVAATIVGVGRGLQEGQGEQGLRGVRELEERWRNRGQMKINVQVIDREAEEEWNGFEDDDDVDMEAGEDAVPHLVPAIAREKVEPEVDEDGFTKVQGKKKR